MVDGPRLVMVDGPSTINNQPSTINHQNNHQPSTLTLAPHVRLASGSVPIWHRISYGLAEDAGSLLVACSLTIELGYFCGKGAGSSAQNHPSGGGCRRETFDE